ncbi:hypothetical protein L2E82_52370 [Cichorium intybus]|nr:hypothetical protein L2E82_52370 [Cichorium intybus]
MEIFLYDTDANKPICNVFDRPIAFSSTDSISSVHQHLTINNLRLSAIIVNQPQSVNLPQSVNPSFSLQS